MTEQNEVKSSPWYNMIRRFVRSREFESPFALRLLYGILAQILEKSLTDGVTKVSGTLDLMSTPEKAATCNQFSGCSAKMEVEDTQIFKMDGKKENYSEGSSTTVFYDPDVDEKNNSDTHSDSGRVTKGKSNKEDFFESDTEDSEGRLAEGRRKSTRKSEGRGGKKSKGQETPEDEEERKLQKLLKMTEIVPSKVSKAEGGEEEEEKVKKEKNGNGKVKSEELSLLDCLEKQESEENAMKDESEEKERGESEMNSVDILNDEVKKVFLLSSDEGEAGCEPEQETSKKGKEEKKKAVAREEGEEKRKQLNDLRWFRISDVSSDDKEEVEGESTASEISTKSLVSDVSSKEKKKRKKRGKSDKELKESESSAECLELSDSDIEQVYHSQTSQSPSKGRKNIKKILKKGFLQVETKQALKMETERKRRLSERQKMFEKLYPEDVIGSKLVLDFDPETKEEPVVVDERLVRKLKPHQRQGVKFMWDSCFESLKRLEEDSGSGCILAHCMGLGKTLQVITLVHTLLNNNTGVRTVMIMCPLNTIKNWLNEFRFWLGFQPEALKPFDLTTCTSKKDLLSRVRAWMRKGGVMILSYEKFRRLVQAKDAKGSDICCSGFLDPGPDLVVCDEGHLLKNQSSNLSKFMTQIKTLRRIVLTGTPLQNNLIEYYCMVQFVKPNILGTRKEFNNRFVNPINNGQFEDSTPQDVHVMKRRAHVLHTMLDGFIQRRSYSVLTPFLPEKQEYVISISLTDSQSRLYKFFIQNCTNDLFKDLNWLRRVWTHPWVLLKYLEKNKNGGNSWLERCQDSWREYLLEEEREDLRGSGKLVLLFHILKKCREIGDKVLVFSQSLESLDLIEFFLKKSHHSWGEFANSWELGVDYFRMDGSTNSKNRDEYCSKFNNPSDRRSRLFLISTKAGGLGINLVAANRVVVFDASWNPSHDVQCIFRVYRFGQQKPCYIYRFLAEATMEEKIYKRQVTKLSLAHRILDEHQIERHYSLDNLQELYAFDPIPKDEWKVPKVPKDSLFAQILVSNRDIVVGYHEHDSLLENKEDEELTEEERRAAWEEYEKEKLTPPQPLTSFDPTSPLVTQINTEALKTVRSYSRGIGRAVPSNPRGRPISHPMCKIVNVRTLQKPLKVNAHSKSLMDIGHSYGMTPYEGETAEMSAITPSLWG